MPLSRDFPKCFATENERSFCQDPIMQICSIFCVTKSQLSYISLSGERCVSEQRTRAHPFSPPPSFLFLLSSWSSSDPSLHFFMARGGGGRGGDAWRVFFHTRKGRTTWNSPNQSSPGARAHTHTHTHTHLLHLSGQRERNVAIKCHSRWRDSLAKGTISCVITISSSMALI